jgi:hypothetical protein
LVTAEELVAMAELIRGKETMSRENSERRERERSAPRVETTTPDYPVFLDGRSYEEANWARLSPLRRDAHNRLRETKGLLPLPPPALDLYEAPKATARVPSAEDAREAQAAARSFLRSDGVPPLRGGEGFTVNGIPTKW